MCEEYLMQNREDKSDSPVSWTPTIFASAVNQLPRCQILPFEWNYPKKVGIAHRQQKRISLCSKGILVLQNRKQYWIVVNPLQNTSSSISSEETN
jgi:hypothetical protein